MTLTKWLMRQIGMLSLVALAAAAPARASVIAITPGDLAGATLIDFGTVQTFAPINGQTINGVTFGFTINGIASTAAVIDDGPGNTNNITIANVVNNSGNAGAVLSMTFPMLETQLGYGYAILSTAVVPNATTVSLFDAANVLVGTLSVAGSPDPLFTGGFLGVASDIPFLRAEVTFSTAGGASAFDNLRFSSTPVPTIPEPTTLALVGLGLFAIAYRRLRNVQ
jgi:hypothetical protein